jgi:hypothetical protein
LVEVKIKEISDLHTSKYEEMRLTHFSDQWNYAKTNEFRSVHFILASVDSSDKSMLKYIWCKIVIL